MRQKIGAIALLLYAFFTNFGAAQSIEIDFELWAKQAKHVERQLENRNVSESLRKQVADWRTLFQSASELNKTPISTVLSQIEALGPLPADNAVDPLEDRRRELEEKLARLKAPAAKVLEALKKADGLIKEIDQITRAQQASALVHLGKSPLNFLAWPNAWSELKNFHSGVRREITATFISESRFKSLSKQGVNLLIRTIISLIMLLGAKIIVKRLAELFWPWSEEQTRLAGFSLTLMVMFLRVAGLCYLINTIEVSGIFEVRGSLLLSAAFSGNWDSFFINWPLWIFGPIWLAQRLMTGPNASLPTEPKIAGGNGVFFFGMLGSVMVARHYYGIVTDYEVFSDQTDAIINFIIITIGSFAIFQLGKIRFAAPIQTTSYEMDLPQVQPVKWRLMATLRRLSNFIAVASPVLAVVGFMNASEALFYPFVQTLALVAFVYLLQVLVGDIYIAIMHKGVEPTQDALLPILIGFFLFLLALPVLALIWGARSVDLVEIWNAFQKGIPIGEARLSPINLLTFVVIFTIGYMTTRFLQSTLKGAVLPKTKIETGAQTAITSGVGYLGIFIAAVTAISSAGIDLSSLAIVAGALSVGIGFGLQNIVSNFVSGIILLIERPVSEGDWIEVGGKMGYVRNISVRSTRIETFDRSDVIVPNADLVSGVVTNYTRGNTIGRLIIPVGVAYGTDTRHVTDILKEIVEAHPMVLQNPGPSIVFQGFGVDSLDFEIRAILRDVNWVLSVKSEINHQIVVRFKEEGIEIPFAQRDIWIRNPEAFSGQGGP